MFDATNLSQVITLESPFGTFLGYIALFFLGGLIGWVGEVFFRRFVSMKKRINPGFLKGPCVPLYGFGLMILHFFSSICMTYIQDPATVPDFYIGLSTPQGTLPFWATSLIAVALIGISLTLVEYLGGLIFIKGLRIKLWDYSKLKGNIQGIICPLFSAIWLVAGAIYWFGLAPLFNQFLALLTKHLWGYTFVLGGCSALGVVDFINSVIVSYKLSGKAKELQVIVDFEKYKILNNKGKKTFTKTSEFSTMLKEAASPISKKIKKVAKEIKAHMYINNEIPTGKNESETPRTKEQTIKDTEMKEK